MSVDTCSRVRALQEVRDATGELDHLQPARHLAERVGHDLAVLGADDPRELVLVALGDLAEREQRRGFDARVRSRASPSNAPRAASTAVSTSAALASGTCAATAPVAGSNTSPRRSLVPSHSLPPTQCAMVRISMRLRRRPAGTVTS